jgi:hypothetical protein
MLQDVDAGRAIEVDAILTAVREIAGALGVSYLASASLGKLGDVTIVGLRLIKVDTAVVLSRATERLPKGGSLVDAIDKVVSDAMTAAAIPPAPGAKPAIIAAAATTPPPPAEHARTRWPWFVGAAAALAVGVVVDTAPSTAKDGRFEALDLAPLRVVATLVPEGGTVEVAAQGAGAGHVRLFAKRGGVFVDGTTATLALTAEEATADREVRPQIVDAHEWFGR